jgi:hypothetical protein
MAVEGGVGVGRMRFGPVLKEFIISGRAKTGRIFSAFVALLQEGIRLSGVTLPPYLTRTEPGNQRQF